MQASDLRSRLSLEFPEVEVWAAGGVVVREGTGGPEVLVVHRPHRSDWSFPKGKLDGGETLGKAAEREVTEETGFVCRRGKRLPFVRYTDGRGREKLVVYWVMDVVSGAFEPNDEVDIVGWFDLRSAARLLTYSRDVELLTALTSGDPPLRLPT